MVLPEVISKEPLGRIRQGDDQWFNIVATLNAMINAEELGISSKNVEAMKSSRSYVQRVMGTSGDMGTKLGLSNDWAMNAIAQVGNYAECLRECWHKHSFEYRIECPLE